MMKKIFGMAAVSALVFGMYACSDGEDGINGKNGADGADGVSCAVKALKDGSGFKVLCDGDSVGVLLNADDGKDGKKGADGKNGSDGEDGNDGKDGIDGKDAKAVDGKDGSKGADGTGCSAKENKAKNGYDIVCDGKTVGTVTNGNPGTATDGDDGEACSIEEGEDGSVTVSCDGKSATLFNDACGTVSYDPTTHFCYARTSTNPRIGVRCKYRSFAPELDYMSSTYDPSYYFCDESNTLRSLCEVKKEDGTTEKVPYVYGTHYCDVDQKKVVAYIPCAPGSDEKRRETQYCYTTQASEGKIYVADMPWCGNSENGKKQYNPRLKACLASTSGADIGSKLGNKLICGDEAAQKDTLNIDIRYPENLTDDGRGILCDDRDWKMYNTTKIGDQVWMAQNLNYAYNLPSAGGTGVGRDTSSACHPDDPDCNTYGRFYLWSAAIDSTKLASLPPEDGGRVCGRGNYCEFDDDVKGVCPTGWHLPSKAEYQTLYDFVGSNNGSDLQTSGSNKYGFSGIQPGLSCMVENSSTTGFTACTSTGIPVFWTSTGAGAAAGNYYNAQINTKLKFGSGNLDLALPIRCIKDRD